MKKMLMMAMVVVTMMVVFPALSSAQDCDGNPCSSGDYVWVQMQGQSWATAGPNGQTAAYTIGQYDVDIDVEGPEGITFTGDLSGGYAAESFSDTGEESWAQGFSASWAEWGHEEW